jgi:hypothetical protein
LSNVNHDVELGGGAPVTTLNSLNKNMDSLTEAQMRAIERDVAKKRAAETAKIRASEQYKRDNPEPTFASKVGLAIENMKNASPNDVLVLAGLGLAAMLFANRSASSVSGYPSVSAGPSMEERRIIRPSIIRPGTEALVEERPSLTLTSNR